MKETYFDGLNADFNSLFSEGIPIINYHMVAPLPWDKKLKGLYIPPNAFKHQLQQLKSNGFECTSIDSVFTASNNSQKKLVVTFDDAFLSVHQNAMKLLDLTGFKAVQFVVADLIGKSNEWDLKLGTKQLPIMSLSQIREWISEGHQIGSHTLTHPYLTRISYSQAREEIISSKKKLEDLFNVPIEHFCYPYGDFEPSIQELVKEAGYSSGSTVKFGVNSLTTNPFQLCRIKGRHPTRKMLDLFRFRKQAPILYVS
jgi:peptidoglycan/xylan/chitin deacetylase (PgdA/CDA1 family)